MTAYHVNVLIEMTVGADGHEQAEERAEAMVQRALTQAAGLTDCVDEVRAYGAGEAIL